MTYTAASDRLMRSMLRSHRMVVRVEWSLDGGDSWDEVSRFKQYASSQPSDATLMEGEITATRVGQPTRFGTLKFGGVTLEEGEVPSILGPKALLRVSRGVAWRAQEEYVPLATVRPVAGEWDDHTLTLKVEDDLGRLAKDPFPLTLYPGGVDSWKLLRQAVYEAASGLPGYVTDRVTPTFTRPFTSHLPAMGGVTIPAGKEFEDRDALLSYIGTLNGEQRLYLDRLGELRAAPLGQADDDEYAPMPAEPVQVVHKKGWSLDGFANRGVCRYDNSGSPAVQTADPASGGMLPADLGFRQTRVWDVTDSGGSSATASDYAAQALHAGYGLKRTWDVEILPAVWIDPGDRVALTCPFHGTAGDFLVDEVTYPLTVDGTMKLKTREWRGGLA